MTNEVVCAMAKREPIGSRTFKRANYANSLNQKTKQRRLSRGNEMFVSRSVRQLNCSPRLQNLLSVMNALSKLSMNAKGHETGDANKVIQGLWIGPELSVMEQLSIKSFLRNGHEYHLYVYDTVKNIPVGTVIKNGHDILPSSCIFQYQDRPSYAGFANFFRYKLLLERGGWWVDTDTICLKPFEFSEPYVFSSETDRASDLIGNCIIKVPIGSEVMAHAWRVCQTKDPKLLVWGETGPRLMAKAVKKYDLENYKQPYYVFCPIDYAEWHKVLEPYVAAIHGQAYAIHLWNEMWRLANQDKNASYHPNCIYEQLKRMYFGDPNLA